MRFPTSNKKIYCFPLGVTKVVVNSLEYFGQKRKNRNRSIVCGRCRIGYFRYKDNISKSPRDMKGRVILRLTPSTIGIAFDFTARICRLISVIVIEWKLKGVRDGKGSEESDKRVLDLMLCSAFLQP